MPKKEFIRIITKPEEKLEIISDLLLSKFDKLSPDARKNVIDYAIQTFEQLREGKDSKDLHKKADSDNIPLT